MAKKSQNVINIISLISIIGVTVGATALIVILSAYNGFDTLIKSLYNSFDPDIKITAAEGKTFIIKNNEQFNKIKNLEGVLHFSEVIEENALFRYAEKQYPGSIKGVSEEFSKMTGIDSMMIEGEFFLNKENRQYAVIGYGIAIYLSVGLNFITPINVYVPKKTKNITLDPYKAINRKYIYPAGIFSIQKDFDAKYVIVPIEFSRELLGYKDEVSAIEIKVNPTFDKVRIEKEIQTILGNKFIVKNRYKQNEVLYKIMKSEKWAIFFILVLILIIASFNIIGSLTMLIIDKKEDINTLQSLGANLKTIRKIFLMEGWFISIVGALFGLFLGAIICFLQQKYGFVPLGKEGASLIIQSYPIDMHAIDFLLVFITVSIIGFIAAYFPIRYITKRFLSDLYIVEKY